MQLLEVKNDTAKIIYNPEDNKLLPSDFILVEDANQRLAGQILNIRADENSNNNIAEARLALAIDKDDKISYYNGYIPSRNAKIIYITADEITDMISVQENGIYLGNLSYRPKCIVKAPAGLVDDRLLIHYGRDENTKVILQNIVSELYMRQKKVILFDFDGRYSRITGIERITISENFKFPLNADAMDSILEYDTADCSFEDKAVIQSIILELKDYVKTAAGGFIPLSLFKDVVINEFSSNPISGLMLLRNKLWQYVQEGLFAEKKADFDIINGIMKRGNLVIADASKIAEKWHKFALQTIPEILQENCYAAFSLGDIPMDKRSIAKLYNNPKIVPIAAAPYDYPASALLKSLCRNQIFFKPLKPVSIDEQYSSLINKLNDDDFILCGSSSLDLALIIKLKPFDVKTSEAIAEHEFRRSVDKILYRGSSVLPKGIAASDIQIQKESAADFTEEDLDFIDSVQGKNINQPSLAAEEKPAAQENAQEAPAPEAYAAAVSEPEISAPKEEYAAKYKEETVPEAADTAEIDEHYSSKNSSENNAEKEVLTSELKEIPLNLDEMPVLSFKEEIRNAYNEENAEPAALEDYTAEELLPAVNNNADEISDEIPDIPAAPQMETDNEKEHFKPEPQKKNSDTEAKEELVSINSVIENIKAEKTAAKKAEMHQEAESVQKPALKPKQPVKQTAPQEEKNSSLNRFDKLKQKVQKNQLRKENEKEKDKKNAGNVPAAPAVSAVNKGRVQKKDLTVYKPEIPAEGAAGKPKVLPFKKGDRVYHPKYGRGTVEGFTNYYSNNIVFCRIDFEKTGRRTLDPSISGLKKID